MTVDLTTNLLCIFSLVHNSVVAEANTVAWAMGTGTGVLLAGLIGTRLRPRPERRTRHR